MPKQKQKRQVIVEEVEKREKRRQAPGKSIKAREDQLISLSVDLAAKQLKSGNASAQVITHFLKLGSSRAELERAKLENENELLKAKKENLVSQKNLQELYANAITAMNSYRGEEAPIEDD